MTPESVLCHYVPDQHLREEGGMNQSPRAPVRLFKQNLPYVLPGLVTGAVAGYLTSLLPFVYALLGAVVVGLLVGISHALVLKYRRGRQS